LFVIAIDDPPSAGTSSVDPPQTGGDLDEPKCQTSLSSLSRSSRSSPQKRRRRSRRKTVAAQWAVFATKMRQTFAKRSTGLNSWGSSPIYLCHCRQRHDLTTLPRNDRRCHIQEERCPNSIKLRRAMLTFSETSRRVSAPLRCAQHLRSAENSFCCIGPSGETSWIGNRPRVGEPRSSNDWQRTSGQNFRESKDSARAT